MTTTLKNLLGGGSHPSGERGAERITPHEARHVCASILIASGLNAKAVSVLMGHSSIAITFDTCGHLFEGSEAEAAELVSAYLEA